MTRHRVSLALTSIVLLFAACEDESLPPILPTAPPPTYSRCTITVQGIIIEQEYLRINSESGKIDTTARGTALDTLKYLSVTVNNLTAEGYIISGKVSVSGFRAGMPWDSSRSVRAEFDAQSGYLLSLHFSHHHGESMTSPGGLNASYSFSASARGEGYVAETDTKGEFVWEGTKAAEDFFYSFIKSEISSVQSSYFNSWTTGTQYLSDCRIVVRFQ